MPVGEPGDPYAPFDPTTVRPTSPGPAPSSVAPGTPEAHTGPDEEASEVEAPLPEFDPRYRDEFDGLMYVGSLTDAFEWLGHEFVIRTLTSGELTEVGLAVKRYEGTNGATKAYQGAITAACLVSVDGKGLPYPITTRPDDTAFQNRFAYVMENYFPPTLDVVYDRYYRLEVAVQKVIEAMGNRSG